MATPIKEIFKDKKYPKWFSSHPIFKEVKTIKKVFPSIGLPNCIEDANIDNTDQAKQSAGILIGDINAILSYRITLLNRSKKTIKNKVNKEKIENCSILLQAAFNQLKKSNDIIQVNNGRVSLKLYDNLTIEGDNRPVFRKNESLFRVYNKLNEMLQEANVAGLDPLENAYSFKAFSTDNIPNNGFKIVFSSDGAEGAWDIGTMSMRGISSCQSWDRGEYKYCTIGSVIDPFVGIIYLTTGGKFNDYGSKMVRRCIVRFVIDGTDNKPYILIDRMYPSNDNKVIAQFKKFIETKTGNKFKVEYAEKMDYKIIGTSYLPLNPIRKKLKETSTSGKSNPYYEYESIQSYQDCKIKSHSGNKKDKQSILFDKNSKKKENEFVQKFTTEFVSAFKTIKPADVPRTIAPAIKTLISDRYYILNDIGVSIAKNIISNIDKRQFTNSDTYIRRVYYSYFNNRGKVIVENNTQLIKKLNGILYLKAGKRFGVRNFIPLINKVFPIMDKAMKEELKKVVEKRNALEIEPLPLP